MRCVVTGGTGYIGLNLCRRLASAGWRVEVLVRPSSDMNRLREALPHIERHEYRGGFDEIREFLEAARPQAVFHLASLARQTHRPEDVAPMVAANITLGCQLLEAMREADCRVLINAGTYSAYDEQGGYRPDSLYAASKRAFESFIDYYCRSGQLYAVSLILFDVYGSDDWRDKLIPSMIRAALAGEEIRTTGGEQSLDFVHVDDVVEGFLRAGSWAQAQFECSGRGQHWSFSLDSGRRTSLRDLAQCIESVVGKPLKVDWGALPYRPYQIFRPLRTGRKLPGWSAQVALPDGLRRVAESLQHSSRRESGSNG